MASAAGDRRAAVPADPSAHQSACNLVDVRATRRPTCRGGTQLLHAREPPGPHPLPGKVERKYQQTERKPALHSRCALLPVTSTTPRFSGMTTVRLTLPEKFH